METKFKVGDVVYDSVNFPNDNGVINNVDNGIRVYFEKNMNFVTYTCKEIKLLSFTPYEVTGFTQERPWQPKEGEWIAVKVTKGDFRLVQFSRMSNAGNYVSVSEIHYDSATPLTDFINENNKLK